MPCPDVEEVSSRFSTLRWTIIGQIKSNQSHTSWRSRIPIVPNISYDVYTCCDLCRKGENVTRTPRSGIWTWRAVDDLGRVVSECDGAKKRWRRVI